MKATDRDRIKVGISACFFHADPARPIFTGKTLQYVEQSIAHWVDVERRAGGDDPEPGPAIRRRATSSLADYVELARRARPRGRLRRLADELRRDAARAERWSGDRIRDDYEIALLAAFAERGKPVLGICRGLQMINVAFGGTLYQDIDTQRPGARAPSRRRGSTTATCHDVEFVAGHAAGRALRGHARGDRQQRPPPGDEGPGARLRRRGACPSRRHDRGDPPRPASSFVAAVQWHPEFHRRGEGTLDDRPLLDDFLAAARAARSA